MIRSMTGYGQAEGTVGALRVLVDVRTVNHRFFSPSIKLPSAFARWETEVREAMRLKVSRGHVTLAARSERLTESGVAIDEARFAAVASQLQALVMEHGLAGGVDLASVLRMPDVLSSPREDDATGTAAELVGIVEIALDALQKSRAEEGSDSRSSCGNGSRSSRGHCPASRRAPQSALWRTAIGCGNQSGSWPQALR